MKTLSYETWLKSHRRGKNLYEKLERSLVPFGIFENISLSRLHVGKEGCVTVGQNRYHWKVCSIYESQGRDVHEFLLSHDTVIDPWDDLLMGYTSFRVVSDKGGIITIYPLQEDYFYRVLDMFLREKWEDLYEQRCAYINNLLARYIILDLCASCRPGFPDPPLLEVAHTPNGNATILARLGSEIVMYAFTRSEAERVYEKFAFLKSVTVVYYIDNTFSRGKASAVDSGRVISIREFLHGFTMDRSQRWRTERSVLMLSRMLYGERIDWDEAYVRRRLSATGLPKQGWKLKRHIPTMLLEDAINAIVEDYGSKEDVFHFISAANLVNAWANRAWHGVSPRRKEAVFSFKNTVWNTLLQLHRQKLSCLSLSMCHVNGARDLTLLADICVYGETWQFRFRGLPPQVIQEFFSQGIRKNGVFAQRYMQPIAIELYQYSYLNKWRLLKKTDESPA